MLRELKKLQQLKSAGALEQARFFIFAGLEGRSLPIHIFRAAYYGTKVSNFLTANLLAIPTPCTDTEFEIVISLYQSGKVFAPIYKLVNLVTHSALEHILKFILYPSKGTNVDFDAFEIFTDATVEGIISKLHLFYQKFISGVEAKYMLACSTVSDKPLLKDISMPVVCPTAIVQEVNVFYVRLGGPHKWLSILGESYCHVVITVNHYALELLVDNESTCSRRLCLTTELPYEESDFISHYKMEELSRVASLQNFFECERDWSSEFLKDKYDTFYHNCHHYVAGILEILGKEGRRLAARLPAKPTPFHQDVQDRRRHGPVQVEYFPQDLFVEEWAESCRDPKYRQWVAKQAALKSQGVIDGVELDPDPEFLNVRNIYIPFKQDIQYIADWEPLYKPTIKEDPSFAPYIVADFSQEELDFFWDDVVETLHSDNKYENDYNKMLREILPGKFVNTLQNAALKGNEGKLLSIFSQLKRMYNGTWTLFQALNLLDRWFNSKGAYYRQGKKVVWCLMLPAARRWIINSAESDLSDLLPDKTQYIDIKDPRENMDILAKRVMTYFDNPKYGQWKDYRRAVNTNPIIEPLLSKWANRLHGMFDFQIGVATNQFVEASYLTASIARYFKANKFVQYNHEYLDDIASAVVETFPESFGNARFVSFYRILNHVNRRLSSTFPFFCDGTTKKEKRSVCKIWKKEIK